MKSGMQMALLGSALALALGVPLGIFVERRLGRNQDGGRREQELRTAEPATTVVEPDERLIGALASLERKLGELTSALERAPLASAAPDSQREPVSGEFAAPPDLTLVLKDLAASLRRIEVASSARPAGGGFAQPLVAPQFVDRAAAFRFLAPMRAADQSDDNDAWRVADRELQFRHLFWTPQMILDAYGMPEEIDADGSQVLALRRRAPGGQRGVAVCRVRQRPRGARGIRPVSRVSWRRVPDCSRVPGSPLFRERSGAAMNSSGSLELLFGAYAPARSWCGPPIGSSHVRMDRDSHASRAAE